MRLLACLLFVLTAVAQDPPPNPQPQPEKPKADCVVKGRILNAVTGEPLKKAIVALQKQGANNAGRQKEVGADGKFEFTAVEPGRYSLSASRTGFVRMSYGAKKPNGPGTQITLAPAQEMKDLVIQLPPHGVIVGRVTDEDGEPMANVTVSASRFTWQGKRRELVPVGGQAQTNDLGEFRLFNVAPDSYIIQATRRQNMGMALEPEPSSSKPEESYITTYYPGVAESASAARVIARSGGETRGVDIRMLKSRVVRVRGTVVNASGKPTSAAVMLAPRNRGWGAWSESRQSFMQDPKQGFDIRDVPPGEYTLTANMMMGMGGDDRQSASMPLDVADHNIEDLVLRLAPGVDVSGTLKAEGGSLDGPPTQIYLEPADGDGPGFSGASAQVKEDGTFTLRGVQTGRFRIRVFRSEAYVKSARAGDQDVLENPLEIGPGAATSLDLVLSLKGAEVSGAVKDKDGKPLSGAMVVLFPQDEKRRTEWSGFGMGTTDQYGAFKVKGLRPGEYKAVAVEDLGGENPMDPDFLKPIESKAKALSLKEAATETLELTVIPADAVVDKSKE